MRKIGRGFFLTLFVATFFSSEKTSGFTGKVSAQENFVANEKFALPNEPDSSALIVEHTGFVLSYNVRTRCPNWVAWTLTPEEANDKTVPRCKNFMPDPKLLKSEQVWSKSYSNSGYTRGHMAPAADMRWSAQAMNDCFYTTNVCPQTKKLNEGDWATLEEVCRRVARNGEIVYIACGPIFDKDKMSQTIGQVRVFVPDAFFKVLMILTPGKERAIGFVFENSDAVQRPADCALSVDEVERITGYDFFQAVPQPLQDCLESTANYKKLER